jgi:hypothetical protein
MKNFRRKKCLAAFIFVFVFAGGAAIVMLLWNALLPAILGVTTVNYLQAAGLIVLSRFLFGGIGHWGHGFHRRREKGFFELHEKMKGMSHQERKDFIHKRMCEPCDDETK